MKSFNEWPIVYEDSELIAGRNPEDPEEYGLNIRNTEDFLLLPRGTLREIALADRDHGKKILDRLMPFSLKEKSLFRGIDYDSFIAAIDKTYMNEEKNL